MRKRIFLCIYSLIVFLVILLSGTMAFSQSSTKEATTITQSGVKISFQYHDKKMLFNHFGNRNNPFVYYVTGPLFVIDVSVEPTVDVRIETGDAVLESERGISKPVLKSEITRYWAYKLRKGRRDMYWNCWMQMSYPIR
jgi:hypothetical protein